MDEKKDNILLRPTGITAIAGLMAAMGVGSSALAVDAAAKASVNRTRYLLLDSRIVANTENAKLTIGTVTKHPANPLFVEDKPWEKSFNNLYANVIHDHEDKLYKAKLYSFRFADTEEKERRQETNK